jgi:hypothetical protein
MRTASCLVALSAVVLAAGCARTAPVASAPAPAVHAPTAALGSADETQARVEHLASESAAFTQKPGDYVVYRFSGGFRKTPLLFAQRVVEASDLVLVVDLTLDDGKHKTNVRAHYTHAPGAPRELARVSRIDATGAERPMSLAEFDALMAQTTLVADDNEGAIGSETVTVSVGGHPMACTETRYRVLVQKHAATMRALSNESFPWGDVGGDIVSDDGRVLYRAEIVDVGGASPIVAAAR